jgi:hypothetical protein
MSKINKEIIHLEINEKLASKLNMTYSDYQNWIRSHALEGESYDDTKDFLAYLGISLFELWKDNIPNLTLDELASYVFSDDSLTPNTSTSH